MHLSYAHITDFDDPVKWLTRINFFAALVREMAKTADVKSVHCIQYSGVLKQDDAEFHFLKFNWLEMMLPLKLHRYIVDQLDPDVIIVHGIHFPFQVLLLRVSVGHAKIIIQHHSEKPLRGVKGFLQQFVDKFTSAYFFPSVEQAVPWVDNGQIKSIGKVHEVIEVPSVFYPVEKEKARAVTKVKSAKIYLWVGRFDGNKDPLTLIRGFIEFARFAQDVCLYVIYQSSELIEEVKSILDEAKDVSERIVLVGKIEHRELLYWFNSADFIISTSHYEGMGVAVCEGMSCGCIPILTNIPSFRKMTGSGECGLLFKAGDVSDLVVTLEKSLSLDLESQRKKTLGMYINLLSAEAISSKMVSVCRQLLSSTTGPMRGAN